MKPIQIRFVVFAACALGCGGGLDRDVTPMPAADGGVPPTSDAGMPTMMPPDPPTPGESGPAGSACTCDSECEGDATHAGVCVLGVCMTVAAGSCASAGSAGECPAGSRCWGLDGVDFDLCWPDCASHECAGTCDSDGSCAPTDATSCNPACGSLCGPGACSPETPMGVCGSDAEVCVDGACVAACSPSSPSGYCAAGSACTDGACVSTSGCPSWVCTGTTCADIVEMPGSTDGRSAEARAAGYYVGSPRYRYVRRDLTLLVQHAACEVARQFPGTNPIALLDLSQADGQVPGTDTGRPRHPAGTHRGGDMDLAYFVTDGTNDGDIVCGDGTDTNGNGNPGRWNDGYFCTTETNIVDWPRQAYWFAKLSATPLVRVFGVDETLADDFRRELDRLLEMGLITRTERDRAMHLGYGNEGGWAFHHHHTHNSYSRP